MATGEILHTLTGHTDSVQGVVFSLDGTRLATSSDGTARIWDADAGQPDLLLASFTKTSTASWSLVTGHGHVAVYDR